MAYVVLLVDFHFELADVIDIWNDEVLHVIMEINFSIQREDAVVSRNVLVKLILSSIVIVDQNVGKRSGDEKVISVAGKI